MKYLSLFLLIFLFILVTPGTVSASLLKISPDGELVFSVLSAQDEKTGDQYKVKSYLDSNTLSGAEVSLSMANGRAFLSVNGGSGESLNTDVTDFKDDVVEIEATFEPEKITVVRESDGFAIVQDGVKAYTNYPISISAKTKTLVLSTPSGERILRIRPKEALNNVVNAHFLSEGVGASLTLDEGQNGELRYRISGLKKLKVFNLVDLQGDVEASISALNGGVLGVTQPAWLTVMSLLFDKSYAV